uniref:Uncharacterized protein n=1 Tax=Oryza glumipatula TaxID=40148 RepID=A0A0E0A1U2_9ORYZ
MTTTTPLGVVPLLEGVVLALTSPGTKNLPPCNGSYWWTPALPLKLYKPKVFDEVFSVLVLFLALRQSCFAVGVRRSSATMTHCNLFIRLLMPAHCSEVEAAVSFGWQAQ